MVKLPHHKQVIHLELLDMKRNLKISKVSSTVTKSNCPREAEWNCGINYRSS